MHTTERAFDLALFEQLNEEYRDRRVLPTPPRTDPEGYRERARQRLERIGSHLELRDKVVLELGAGQGWLTSIIASDAGARRAIGVDIAEHPQWQRFDDPRISLLVADLATDNPLQPESVDVVVSTAVLEHVRRPVDMLAAIYATMRPGARAWLYINLHRGPRASHRYRDVYFPWPHLLFEPDVCREFYEKHHGTPTTFAWVNSMTTSHYLEVCRELRFDVEHLRRRVIPIDVPFYLRFRDRLEHYPALDLETDFLELVLHKRPSGKPVVPGLDYVARQRTLDRAILEHAGAGPGASTGESQSTEEREQGLGAWVAARARGTDVLEVSSGERTSWLALAHDGRRVLAAIASDAAVADAGDALEREGPGIREGVRIERFRGGPRPAPGTRFETVVVHGGAALRDHLPRLLDELRSVMQPGEVLLLTIPFGAELTRELLGSLRGFDIDAVDAVGDVLAIAAGPASDRDAPTRPLDWQRVAEATELWGERLRARLEQRDHGDPGTAAALEREIARLERETSRLRNERQLAADRAARLRTRVRVLEASRWWRAGKPVRTLAGRLRYRRRAGS